MGRYHLKLILLADKSERNREKKNIDPWWFDKQNKILRAVEGRQR